MLVTGYVGTCSCSNSKTLNKWTIFSCVVSSLDAVSSASLGSEGICGHFDGWGPATAS